MRGREAGAGGTEESAEQLVPGGEPIGLPARKAAGSRL